MRMIKNTQEYLDQLSRRTEDFTALSSEVLEVLENVRTNGDQALRYYTAKWDCVDLSELRVQPEEIQAAFDNIEPELLKALKQAKDNIENYHKIQIKTSQFIQDGMLGELVRPLNSVGIYVPGGKAAYPSTVLMNGVPAKLAGVKRLVMVTPPMVNGSVKASVLVAAALVGVDEIYKVGGAQSIAALAYGTPTIDKVLKIVGPGNIYVALAKKLVSDFVGIDMIAGPSEVLVLMDQSSNPEYVAADLIAQAEHDERAAAIVLSTDEALLEEVRKAVMVQIASNPRRAIIQESLENHGALMPVTSRREMVALANAIAPEHLEILCSDPETIVDHIETAGAIFVGGYSPEALGDYYAGPNHTLPTSGTAKFSSPLGVDDFVKKTSYIRYTKDALLAAADDIIRIAEDEGLYGHANAIKIRRL